jgi:hypothetical protein
MTASDGMAGPPPSKRLPPRGGARTRVAIRRFHGYAGVFIAPSVLFFAVSGAMQLFNLHEVRDGYTPPAVIAVLAQVHKDQRLAAPVQRPDPDLAQILACLRNAKHKGGGDRPATPTPPVPANVLALKWLFLLEAVALFVSTVVGLWMALTSSRRKHVIWLLIAAGAALPALILAL